MNDLFRVADSIQAALDAKGYATLTPVQQAVLEPEHHRIDLLVSAQTGTGKTVAFGLAIAQNLLADEPRLGGAGAPRALVIAPTRELALQVQRELTWLFAEAGAVIASCVGGMDPRDERRILNRGAHIVVGTPGRLVDHIDRGALELSGIRAVVLDEADEMLDLGFREDLEHILDAAPEDRRTLLFSATVSKPIARLAQRFQRGAVRVSTMGDRKPHEDIAYRAVLVAQPDREAAIINLLRYHAEKKAIVFCGTRAMVNTLAERFASKGFTIAALSGELSQKDRSQALEAMRRGKARICVATDVAARGIDLPELDLVIHADPPNNIEALLHRSGRTGRAGRKGESVLIATPRSKRAIERLLKGARVPAEWDKPPSVAAIRERDDARLLKDPALLEPLHQGEQEIVARLLAEHAPEQLAAAFLRGRRADLSPPEHLREAPEPRSNQPRADIEGGEWIALAIGRDQRADVRWLLPMLCKAGGFTKRDIGAIRIQQNETHAELAPGGVKRLMEAIGPDRRLEDGIRVAPLLGRPPEDKSAPREQSPKSPQSPKRERRKSSADDAGLGARSDSPKGAARGSGPEARRPRADKAGAKNKRAFKTIPPRIRARDR